MRYIILIALALAVSGPVLAQGNNTKGDALSYTTAGVSKATPPMRHRTLYTEEDLKVKKPDPYRPLQKGEAPKPPTQAELEAAKAWQRYKALARGESKQKDAEEVPEEDAMKTSAPTSAGLAGIIDQYGKNKAQRGQMKMIRVAPPEEKPAEKTESKDAESKGK